MFGVIGVMMIMIRIWSEDGHGIVFAVVALHYLQYMALTKARKIYGIFAISISGLRF
jgi:uncharacterized RDD family membrane protein YckC